MSDIIKIGFVVYDTDAQKYMSSKSSKNFSKSFGQAVMFKTANLAHNSIDCRKTRERNPNAVVLPVTIILDEKVVFEAVLTSTGVARKK